MEEQGTGPGPDMQNVYEQGGGDGANIPLAVVGAAAGGAAGGLVWFLIEHFAHYQIGFIAILCGAAAGWGAVILGKGHGFQIGVIAAVFGVLGVVGGSYGSFAARKAEAKDQLTTELAKYPGFSELSADEQRAALAIAREGIDSFGYIEWVKQDTKSATWMAIFGVIGLVYGFSIGNGGLKNKKDDDGDYDA